MTFNVTLAADFLFSWESQANQYPAKGRPGVSYFAGETPLGTVDCLLYRDIKGNVVGILNHYGFDSIWEKPGNVNIWVRPDKQRRGIATLLVREAARRWDVNLDQQRFTESGAALATRLRADGIL